MSYVVLGLSGECDEYPGHDCVILVNGPFDSRAEADDDARRLPEGFRPHILPLVLPDVA